MTKFYSDPVFPSYFDKKCSNDFKVGVGKEMSRRVDCERECINESKCQFYFFSKEKLCVLYSKCNNYTKQSYFGRSYRKTGNTLLELQVTLDFYFSITFKRIYKLIN